MNEYNALQIIIIGVLFTIPWFIDMDEWFSNENTVMD